MKSQDLIQRAKQEAQNPIPQNERISSIIFFGVSLLMFSYLLLLQLNRSQFYTEDFQNKAMFAQYGFWGMWIITAFLEGVLGKRFASRAFDIFGGILLATVASFYLAITFPYNFDYFTDVMPGLIAPLFSWISNGIGQAVLWLAFLFHFVALFISPFAYKFIQRDDLAKKKNS